MSILAGTSFATSGSSGVEDEATRCVEFYEENASFIELLAEFVGSALGGGHPCIAIVTAAHRRDLLRRLVQRGMAVQRMIEDGRFFLLDANDTLKLFMVDGSPCSERFSLTIGGLLSKVKDASGDARLAVFGEMVALLCAEGNYEAAVRLERLWTDLGKRQVFSLLSAYPAALFTPQEGEAAFRKICEEHSPATKSVNKSKSGDTPVVTTAHEINNPLEAVTNVLYLAKTSDGVSQEVHRYLEVAEQELARVVRIAQKKLNFSRRTA